MILPVLSLYGLTTMATMEARFLASLSSSSAVYATSQSVKVRRTEGRILVPFFENFGKLENEKMNRYLNSTWSGLKRTATERETYTERREEREREEVVCNLLFFQASHLDQSARMNSVSGRQYKITSTWLYHNLCLLQQTCSSEKWQNDGLYAYTPVMILRADSGKDR